MVEAARLSVVVDSDTKGLQSGLKTAHSALQGFSTTATTALGGAAKAGAGLVNSLGALGLAASGLGALATGIGGVATGMVAGNAQMETYETQLGTLLGSADKAKARLAELADFGARTPFELPEVVRAEKVLLGFGLTGQKAVQLTGQSAEQLRTIIGDVAAGTGASFEEIALNFGKFSAGATGEAISRLQELGVVTREQMTAMGIQFSAAGELMSPLPKAMEVAVKIAQQKFGGGMDALSKTFAGQMSTLSDNFTQAKNVVTQPIFDVLKTAIGGLNQVMSSGGFQRALQSVAQTLAGAVKSGVDLAASGFQTLLAIAGPLSERLTTFFGSLTGGATLATTVNRAFGDLIPAGLNPILDAVDAAFRSITTTAGQLVALLQGEGLAGVWAAVQAAMADFAPTGERVQAAVEAIATAIAALVPQPIRDLVESLLASGAAAAEGESPMRALADAVNAVSGAVAGAVKWLREHEVVLYAVAGAAAAVAAALVVQQGVQLAVTVATTAATAAQWLLNAALTANPIGIVVVALGALAGALIYAYTHSETFRKFVDAAFDLLKSTVTTAIAVATDLITDFGVLLGWLQGIIEVLAAAAVVAFAAITTAISSAWATVKAATTTTWTTIKQTLTDTWDALSAAASTVFAAIQATVTTAWTTIQTTGETVWAAVSSLVSSTWSTVEQTIAAAVAGARDAVETRLAQITGLFQSAKEAIEGIVNAIKSVVERIFGEMESRANSAKDTMRGILDTVQGWYNTIIGLISAARSAFASRPSGGGGGGGAPSAPAMPSPSGSEPAPAPSAPPPGTLRPVGPQAVGAQSVAFNLVMPPGSVVYGSLADLAREIRPELARLAGTVA